MRRFLAVTAAVWMRGVTKPVTLDVEVLGTTTDSQGRTRSGFTASTTVNRKEFGIAWNKEMEAGGLLLGDDVEILIEVEGIQQ